MDKKYYLTVPCEICGKDVNITKYRYKARNGYVLCRKCSINKTYKDNPEKLKIANEKRIATVQKMYNCDNVAQNKEVQQKWVQTKFQKTGYKGAFADPKWIDKIEDAAHSEEAMKKKEATFEHRFGTTHHMKNKDVVIKMHKDYKERTGFDWPTQNPDVIKKYRRRGYIYNSIFFDSSWELAYYIYLTDSKIPFEYHPKDVFWYKDDIGKRHTLHPDFKLYNRFFQEVKGDHFFNEKNEPWDPYHKKFWWDKYYCLLQNNIEILKYSGLKKYIIYVKNTYGKSFFKDHRVKK